MTAAEERAYAEGRRAVRISQLREILRDLDVDDIERQRASWLVERQELIAVLRRVCEAHGDNLWDEDLHLGDVVEKHLERHLEGRRRRA